MANNNADDQVIIKLITSPLAKTMLVILITTAGFSYNVFNAKNDIQKDIISTSNKINEIKNEIQLQNQAIKFELKEIRTRQENDYRYITENYLKKTEISKITR